MNNLHHVILYLYRKQNAKVEAIFTKNEVLMASLDEKPPFFLI